MLLRRPLRRRVSTLASLAFAAICAGCDSGPKLEPHASLASPYVHGRLWAVAPLRNESGVSRVDGARMADAFAQQVQLVSGIDCLPVNRVLLVMDTLNIREVTTPAQAESVRRALHVDGLIVGTITEYDPYRPPKLGAAIQLFSSDDDDIVSSIDPVALSRSAREPAAPAARRGHLPTAQAAGMFDATDHEVLYALGAYARGRTEPDSAYGPDIYLVSMEMYTQFVAHELLARLLQQEQTRLASVSQPPD